ncbi:hypothetical protein CEY11_09520 [Candidimonas nitroreducens]|uniref:Uncharacterized protein n=1 Tax=Candidimonas nitroreducens TaxID=683354 RepID=A0A225MLA8_9BURK|nr:hypothetical protein CEY11_09520 [Candidimonas nitroreducens]
MAKEERLTPDFEQLPSALKLQHTYCIAKCVTASEEINTNIHAHFSTTLVICGEIRNENNGLFIRETTDCCRDGKYIKIRIICAAVNYYHTPTFAWPINFFSTCGYRRVIARVENEIVQV